MSKQRGRAEPHITEDRSELLGFYTFIAKICTYNTLGFICLVQLFHILQILWDVG